MVLSFVVVLFVVDNYMLTMVKLSLLLLMLTAAKHF